VAARAAAIAAMRPTDPCTRCGRPLGADPRVLDLDHTDDRTAYAGLAHQSCNRAAGQAAGIAHRNFTPSRRW
jgi:hypothetical protein